MANMQWIVSLDYDAIENLTNDSICPSNLTDPINSGWVFNVFGECVTNIRQWFAFCIGLTSILFWLLAQFPQLVTNCRTGKADTALSFWFLLSWFLGDATNLIGAILTQQLATQVTTAGYFMLIDTVMMAQFVYYVVKNQGVKGLLNCFKIRNTKPELLAILLPGMVFTLLFASHGPHMLTREDPYQVETRVGRTLMHIDIKSVIDFSNPADVVGYILGCLSALFYVASRVPQIVKNCQRCSVEGLSPLMFVLAVLGNVTYGLGIILYSVEPVFLLQKLPWLVGSVGTLFFDFTIIVQFLMSCCSRMGRRNRRYRSGEKGSDKEPLLNPSDNDCSSWLTQNRKGSIQNFKKTFRRSPSQQI